MIQWTPARPTVWMSQTGAWSPDTGSREEPALNATLKYPAVTTDAVDLAKEIFELAFADASARIVARQRLKRESFGKGTTHRDVTRAGSLRGRIDGGVSCRIVRPLPA